jgi:hypothetical protein
MLDALFEELATAATARDFRSQCSQASTGRYDLASCIR